MKRNQKRSTYESGLTNKKVRDAVDDVVTTLFEKHLDMLASDFVSEASEEIKKEHLRMFRKMWGGSPMFEKFVEERGITFDNDLD